jgi:hypothetical protein
VVKEEPTDEPSHSTLPAPVVTEGTRVTSTNDNDDDDDDDDFEEDAFGDRSRHCPYLDTINR